MQDESWPKGWKIRRFYRNFKTSKNSPEKVKEDARKVKEDVEKVMEVEQDVEKHKFKYPGEGSYRAACKRCKFKTPDGWSNEEVNRDLAIHVKQDHAEEEAEEVRIREENRKLAEERQEKEDLHELKLAELKLAEVKLAAELKEEREEKEKLHQLKLAELKLAEKKLAAELKEKKLKELKEIDYEEYKIQLKKNLEQVEREAAQVRYEETSRK